MEPDPHRRKIEEAVISILKNADLETDSECSIRATATERLGIDLSDLECKKLVRRTVESFLLSLPPPPELNPVEEDARDVVEEPPETSPAADPKLAREDRVICKLSEKRILSIQNFRGRPSVSIRDYYQKNGQQFPSGRGISLTANQWSAFRLSFPNVEKAIVKMESRIRSKDIAKQSEVDITASSAALATQSHIPSEKTQFEAAPQALVPIATTRLNGKNYHCWSHQMEFFLMQLKIAYVLTDPCPHASGSPDESLEERIQAKVDAQKWINDDYVCYHNILNSLSDHLFDQYSTKNYSARELWEALKSAYDDDFGTKRSQVNKYIQFQMIDGVSIIEQVEELHKIADSIVASGIWFDENFHVSTIISKLPRSWKECREKLMREELLPLNKLMYHLRDEEELRNRHKKDERSKNDPDHEDKLGPRKREPKVVCFTCGKEGHRSRNCRSRRLDRKEQGTEKENNGVHTSLEVGMVDRTVG